MVSKAVWLNIGVSSFLYVRVLVKTAQAANNAMQITYRAGAAIQPDTLYSQREIKAVEAPII